MMSSKRLIDIDLSEQEIELTDESIPNLIASFDPHALIKLNVSMHGIGAKEAILLAQCPNLISLNIDRNNLGNEGAVVLAKSKSLRELSIAYNKIGYVGIQALAENKTITSLDVSGNTIDYKSAAILAESQTLRKLSLERNRIGDKGAIAFKCNKKIQNLNLSYNGVSDLGIVELAKNLTLLKLDLTSNKVQARGAEALANNANIKHLDLSINSIGNAGAKAFLSNSTMLSFSAVGNGIDKEIDEQLTWHFHANRQNSANLERNSLIKLAVLLALHRYHNNSAPICQLPQEMLIRILGYLAFPSHSSDSKKQLSESCTTFVFDNISEYEKRLNTSYTNSSLWCLKQNPLQKQRFEFPTKPVDNLREANENIFEY
jgi:hypothetical protein